MERRKFVSGCVAFLCIPFGFRKRKIPVHYYDWQRNSTTDPRFVDGLVYGEEPNRGRLILNGSPINKPMTRMLTGNKGWIEWAVKDKEGQIIIKDDHMKVIMQFGVVEYKCPQ